LRGQRWNYAPWPDGRYGDQLPSCGGVNLANPGHHFHRIPRRVDYRVDPGESASPLGFRGFRRRFDGAGNRRRRGAEFVHIGNLEWFYFFIFAHYYVPI
jgi:hypothetical protein